ncbi:MAG: Tc toxin subunit A [Planctomycetia bacterium]|nr:Tc toxin subunit A [Planctomycetia bacterium]
MNTISFPLTRGNQGPKVADLQEALQQLLARGVILAADDVARRELAEILRRERTDSVYGPGTHKLVSIFQDPRRLQPSGNVDELTASALNALIKEWELGLASTPTAQVVSGKVRREDDVALRDVRVRAFHEAASGTIRLGEDITDAEGRYTIRYELLPGVSAIQLRVLAIGEDGKTLRSSDVMPNAKPLTVIDLIVPVTRPSTTQRRVEGRIVLERGQPVEKVKLRLYRRDFGGKSALVGETTTLAGGRYAFTYDPGDKRLSLEVRAVNAANQEVPLSKPLNNLNGDSVINLVAPATLQPVAAEYQRLSAALAPIVGQLPKLAEAKENKNRQDLTVLNRATGWDARLIALAATTEKLSADPDVKLPQQGLYGLLRAGLPSDKFTLAQVTPDVAEQALKTARTAGIVALSDQQISQFKTDFTTFSNKVRLARPVPGSTSTYADLLKDSGVPAEAQTKFAPIYLNHRGDAAQLWTEAKKAGLKDSEIGKLQLQGKLAFLAGNSQAMTNRLMQKAIHDPAQLVDQDFHLASKWMNEVFDQAGIPAERRNNLTDADKKALEAVVPVAYAGEKVEDRLKTYAEDMSRKVRLSYPTQVVRRLVEQDATDAFKLGAARTSTANLLKNASGQGFRMGETPVAKFLKTHPGATAGMTTNEVQSATQQVKTLQRVYQITPTNEAMPVLMSLGMKSAYDVMAYPEETFVELYTAKYKGIYGKDPVKAETKMIRRKAKQVSSVTYNLFAIAKKMASEPAVAGLSAPVEVRESVQNELIKEYPTLESLFGSMDFCECQHCRSVLSPAAYLVDLLQFVDAEPEVWGNFLAHWKSTHNGQEYTAKYLKPFDALIERRPDIPHIALTCENTHTALPYIDIVNELLEYFVAHGKLEEQAANDTDETATTAELLAEPQNVIREAYDKLRTSRYPLELPFELWIETVRQFCNAFETPLARLLEVFRPSDTLFAPTQPFDRASIFVESLGLSPAEFAIFTDPNPIPKWFELYGFATAAEATTVATDATTGQRIDLNSAKALSRRLGVTYKALVEIIETGFVNPKLATLGILDKLKVSIRDVRFYLDNKALISQNPATLTTENKQKRLEAVAFDKELKKLAVEFQVPLAQLEAELQAIPFASVLVLADPDAGCNFDLTTLRYANGNAADDIAFLRINLFVRLWRKLGWTIEETDRALCALVPKNAPFEAAHLAKLPLKSALIHLAHLKELDEKLRIGKQNRIKLLTLWTDIPTTGTQSLYAQLFLTPSVLKTDDVFDNPLGQYLSATSIASTAQLRKHRVQKDKVAPGQALNPAAFAAHPKVEVSFDALEEVQYLSFQGVMTDAEKAVLTVLAPAPLPGLLNAVQTKAKEFSLVKGHLLALQGALGLTADDIEQILADAAKSDPNKSLDKAALSLANVSLLYRYGLLAKALKLSVKELVALKQLSGLEPFQLPHADPLTTIEQDSPFTQTLRFVEIAGHVKESGLKVEDLDYLLRHEFDPTGKYRQNAEARLALLKTLAEGIRAIRTEHAVPDDPASLSDDQLRQKLGLVLPPDVVERFLAMWSGTVEFTATRTAVASANQLNPAQFAGERTIPEVKYNTARQEQKLTFRGVLFDTQKNKLKADFPKPVPPNPHVPSVVFADLLDDVQKQAKAFFEKHFQKQAPGVQPVSGFLAAADFDVLFDQNRPLQPGETDQDRARTRRKTLANAFLPFLQDQLVRQLIVQTLVAYTTADPVLVESLLTDSRMLGSAKPLLDSFAATSERGITATFFVSPTGADPALPEVLLVDANTGLKDGAGNPLRPAAARSARLEGYLEVSTPGAYRFTVALDKQNAEAELRFDHLPNPLFWKGTAATDNAILGVGANEYLELKPGVPYRFTLWLRKLAGGEARMLVQGETLPKDGVAQLTLYPHAAVKGADDAVVLLTKVLQLVQALGLSEREMRYLATHAADFDNLKLSQLPTATSNNPALAKQLFGQFLRLAGYTRLKRDLAGGTDDLIGVFEANGTGDLEKVYSLVAKSTRRSELTVKAGANALFAAPKFASEKPLQRLWEVLQVVERFGVQVSSLLEWTRIVSPAATADRRFAIARNLREAIKARFEQEGWQRIAQPIFDKLRQHQRDTLVSFVMHQRKLTSIEQLYEYFLIDPGMEPVVQTSRIRLASASVQLFIQRCLLNLEPKVHPSVINARQWEWMKRYRVWEANRKIFLFPENWLEPEFRDDKTHLFTELEGTLLEGDVSSDLVEDAFLAYLKKLDELARLEIAAVHLEDNSNPAERTLHVIGRTYSLPHKYFYRRYAHQMWTPWEPVSAEIDGDHLAPVVWRDRLYLFWVTFLEKAKPNSPSAAIDPTKPIPPPQLATEMEAHLHWSEYFQGEWTTRESAGVNVPDDQKLKAISVDPRRVFIFVSKEYENGEERGVYVHLSWPFNQSFHLAGRNGVPTPAPVVAIPGHPYTPAWGFSSVNATSYVGSGAFKVTFVERVQTTNGGWGPTGIATPDILQQGGAFSLLPCNNDLLPLGVSEDAYQGAADPDAVKAAIERGLAHIAALMKPVFYQDRTHTLFVEPNVVERTVEEWEEWVTQTPQPDSEWKIPEWWKDIKVIPEFPQIGPIPDPGPWTDPIDEGSLIYPRPDHDWLVNPATGLLFDDAVIGPGGKLGLEIVTPQGNGFSGVGTPVSVNPGSGLAPGSAVVIPTNATRNGVAFAGGLSVVGGSGLNSALAMNAAELDRNGFANGVRGNARIEH